MNEMIDNSQLEVSEYTGEGYDKTVRFESWRVAILNYTEKFKEGNMKYLEKHCLTDEVFVLLSGSAVLVLGKEMERVPLEKNKLYNVKKDAWHNIILEPDSKILIVENDNTGPDNTEYFYF